MIIWQTKALFPLTAHQVEDLKGLSRQLIQVQTSLSPSRGFTASERSIPVEFIMAWLHMLLGLVRNNFKYARGREKNLKKAKALVQTGRRLILLSILKDAPSKKETALPFGILSLILDRITANVVGSSEISRIYRNRLDSLVNTLETPRKLKLIVSKGCKI